MSQSDGYGGMAAEGVDRLSDSTTIKAAAVKILSANPLISIQYFEIVDPSEVQPVATAAGPVRIAAAIFIGNTRLIDNVAAGISV